MKNEKMLEFINEFNATGDYSIITKLEETLKADIKEDIRKKEVKKTGNVKIDSILKKIYKSRSSNEALQGYSKVDNRFLFTDSYRMIVVSKDYGYTEMKSQMNFSNYIKPNLTDYKEIEIDLKELETHVKLCKAKPLKDRDKKQACYNLPETDIYINGIWLLEELKAFKTNTIKVTDRVSPMYIGDITNEFAMLLPIRKN